MTTTSLTGQRGRPKGLPKTGGRRMGTPNKVTVEVRTWARSVVEDRQVHAKTLEMARTGRLAPGILIELLHYAYGKPKETTDLNVRVSRLIRIIPPPGGVS
jgi:hypothetical protein